MLMRKHRVGSIVVVDSSQTQVRVPMSSTRDTV